MITIYETAFHGPTNHRGTRIKVTNTRTGKSKWHHWDYAVNHGIDQHEEAVRRCALFRGKLVELGGQTKRGWLFALTHEEGE